MIARGSADEEIVRRHIALWQGMIVHWSTEADSYRQAARGSTPVGRHTIEDADLTLLDIRHALETCDGLTDRLAPGHDLRPDLMRVGVALAALAESVAFSIDRLLPRVAQSMEIAGLRYLVSALKRDTAGASAAGESA